MGVFTDLYEILPHAMGLNKEPNARNFLRKQDFRQWQVHFGDDFCDKFYTNDIIPLAKGKDWLLREWCYLLDSVPQIEDPEIPGRFQSRDWVGWIVIKEGRFVGVEIIKTSDQFDIPDDAMCPNDIAKKWGLSNPEIKW